MIIKQTFIFVNFYFDATISYFWAFFEIVIVFSIDCDILGILFEIELIELTDKLNWVVFCMLIEIVITKRSK